MENDIAKQLKELSHQYARGFFNRTTYQQMRSELLDSFIARDGNDTVTMAASGLSRDDSDSSGNSNSSDSSDILAMADALSVSENETELRQQAKNKTDSKPKSVKSKLLLIISGVMLIVAGCLFYLMASQQ
ncbi:MAG: hypothetical protein JKY24_01300 [Pseudomonadales bacterium]|nr:hypothetical protein [Pseudomonadales bacterium]